MICCLLRTRRGGSLMSPKFRTKGGNVLLGNESNNFMAPVPGDCRGQFEELTMCQALLRSRRCTGNPSMCVFVCVCVCVGLPGARIGCRKSYVRPWALLSFPSTVPLIALRPFFPAWLRITANLASNFPGCHWGLLQSYCAF